MIKRSELVMTMGVADMSYKALHIALNEWKDVCLVEVKEMIAHGVTEALEWLEPYVAWVLGLKKHIPDGWTPKPRVIELHQTAFSFPKEVPAIALAPKKPAGEYNMCSRWTLPQKKKLKALVMAKIPYKDILILQKRTMHGVRSKVLNMKASGEWAKL